VAGGLTGGSVSGGGELPPPPPPPQAVRRAATNREGNFRCHLLNVYMVGSFMARFYANFRQYVFLLYSIGRGKIAFLF
jgi:hypothetical protein